MGNNVGSSNQSSHNNLDDPNQNQAGPQQLQQEDANQQYQENAQAQISQYEQIPSPLDGITLKDLEYKGYKQEDPAYGEIKVYKVPIPQGEPQQPNQEGEQEELMDYFEICVKSKIFDSKEDCRDHHSELQKKEQLVHPRLARLLKTQAIINSNFCTNIYKIDMAYEYLEHNLEVEIQNRYGTDQHFEEDDIFNLIEQVMDALYFLKCSGVQHGDIQPKTVLIDREGNFKITDIQFLTSGICGYKKHLIGLETQCFLAPELLSNLRRQTILEDDEVDQERADIFSLGLIALAMASLQPVDKIYDFDTYTIHENEIHDLLEIVLQNYSPNLHFLIVNMLNQVDRRIDLESGLHLVDQMRAGQFNLEEYEMKRFQSELEQSDKKLIQSIQQNPNLQNSAGKAFSTHGQESPQAKSRTDNPKLPGAGDNNNPANDDQAGPLYTNSSQAQGGNGQIQDMDSEQKKRSKNPQLQNNLQGNQQNPLQGSNYDNNQYPQQQRSQTHLQSNQDIKKFPKNQNNNQQYLNPPSNQDGGRYSVQNSEQKSDRYDTQNHSPTHPNNQKQNHLQYQNLGHQHSGQPTNLQDIDSRVRDALLRSQQVSLKFENSPLRLFRDQLLADELYVPLDPQFSNSGYNRSKHLESSVRKNQSNKIHSTNNSHIYSAQKNSRKLDSHQSQSKVLQQKKWKI